MRDKTMSKLTRKDALIRSNKLIRPNMSSKTICNRKNNYTNNSCKCSSRFSSNNSNNWQWKTKHKLKGINSKEDEEGLLKAIITMTSLPIQRRSEQDIDSQGTTEIVSRSMCLLNSQSSARSHLEWYTCANRRICSIHALLTLHLCNLLGARSPLRDFKTPSACR